MPANWKTQQWPQDWKRAIFIPIPRKAMPNSIQIILQLHSFHMLSRLCSKSLKLSFSRTWTENFQIFRLDSEKADDQIANIHWIIEKASKFLKKIYFCLIDSAKAFDCVDHNHLWNILKEMGIPDHLTCLLRNLCAGQEATVRTGHGTVDWFKIGKGVHQGCILSPWLFNLYAEYIMQSAGLKSRLPGKITSSDI